MAAKLPVQLRSGTGKNEMCPTIDSFHFGADTWNVAFYEAMSSVAKTTRDAHEKAKHATKIIAFPVRLWMLERDLRAFVEFLQNPSRGYKGSRPSEDVPSDRVAPAEIAERLLSLGGSIDKLYIICKRNGWTNRTITAASLNLLHKHADFIQDFGEMVFVALDPETEERFERARRQYEAGETVGIEAIH